MTFRRSFGFPVAMDGNCQDNPVENSGSEVKASKIIGSASRYVKLNVGGWLYYTTIGTLTKEDSMLRAMFSGRMDVLTDQDGWVLIDRCGKNFDVILNYLRDGSVALPACNAFVEQIMAEATYYCLQVEFPEARIYEEAMNALLYENVAPTPARCADAGSPSVAVCQHCLSNVFNDEVKTRQVHWKTPNDDVNSLENSNVIRVVESFKNDLEISHSKYSAKYIQGCKEVKKARIIGPPYRYVKLNVGGCLYYTTIGTLTKEESMLRLMFTGKVDVLTDEDGWILIDRCGKYFDDVLNFLRDGKVALPSCKIYVQQLLIEASHYSLNGLIRFCQNWLDSLHMSEEVVKTCHISLVNSSEEKLSLQYVKRPVIKLTINRKHQKYAYCANAATDANLLKNLELFDKLALRFKDRILFIKDVGLSNEICSWSFYTSSQKEVQVEFPEARIYEEAMNTLLRENIPSAPCTDAGSPLVKQCQHCLSSISGDEVTHDKATSSLKTVHGPP
ncbi:BTB/POZ domain-containing adapter for CUL3-mediated RhoA degradation protein 2 [Trichinella patagoniensis]|uniref:BTB/POZ domain-containing adapter for CUL3-mediated RhoA degradation protein 2 n=1 Tax=Trichinella patagoniensis TaxID=990121 RepID=A0A0V1A0W5_9BILA|nr:BTB/POZ domain-containing adapter for CUL3-mediated RhoA degradation protein 2 [Trichinella patagoniensis]